MWVLLKGHVEIKEMIDNQDVEEHSRGIRTEQNKTLKAVSTFGEQVLLDNKKRNIGAICKEDCEFALLEKADYIEIKRNKIFGI